MYQEASEVLQPGTLSKRREALGSGPTGTAPEDSLRNEEYILPSLA